MELGPELSPVGKQPTHLPQTAYGMSPSLEASPTEETWGTGSRGSVQGEWSPRSGRVVLALASLTGSPSLESGQGQSSIPESPVRWR